MGQPELRARLLTLRIPARSNRERATVASNNAPITGLDLPLRIQQMYMLLLQHTISFMESRRTTRAWSVPLRRMKPWRRYYMQPTEAANSLAVPSKKGCTAAEREKQ